MIRDIDANNSQTGRKSERADSDEEDQPLPSTMNGRGALNLYQQRQQKRVKLTTSAANAD